MILTQVSSQIYNAEIEANITFEGEVETATTISCEAFNKTEINRTISYRFSTIKKSNGNLATNEQSGRAVLVANEKKVLSQSTINFSTKDTTIVMLLIYEDEKIVGKSRKVFHGLNDKGDLNDKEILTDRDNQDLDIQDSKKDGIELRGMVIEDTKTKPGRDFYQYFYSQYLSKNINGNEIVTIKEELGMANSTRMKILVGDKAVAEFFLNPRNDFIRQMAEASIARVQRYFLMKEKTKQQTLRY